MIAPAIAYKSILEEKFAQEIYSERFFYYVGYQYGFELPNIRAQDNYFQWAILDNESNVIGYLAYFVEPDIDSVERFGLYSFDEGNLLVIEETYKVLEELVKTHHRVEWRVISGNHAKRGYDNFCKKHGGNIVCLHDVTKDRQGNYHDAYIYEVIKK